MQPPRRRRDCSAIPAALPTPARAVVLARANAALSELVLCTSERASPDSLGCIYDAGVGDRLDVDRDFVARAGKAAVPRQQARRRSQLVQLISLAEHGPRACSVENAEVGLEHDRREVGSCIAWLSERLASGPTLTAQIRGMKLRRGGSVWFRS